MNPVNIIILDITTVIIMKHNIEIDINNLWARENFNGMKIKYKLTETK